MIDTSVSVAQLNQLNKNTIMEHIGIEITALDAESITGKMPVDHRTHQPFGLLHGGASVVLAETLGSIASTLILEPKGQYCVGLDINANHIRGVKEGWVYGTARALHLGRSTHVWEIKITNEAEKLVCVSRLTMAVMTKQ